MHAQGRFNKFYSYLYKGGPNFSDKGPKIKYFYKAKGRTKIFITTKITEPGKFSIYDNELVQF